VVQGAYHGAAAHGANRGREESGHCTMWTRTIQISAFGLAPIIVLNSPFRNPAAMATSLLPVTTTIWDMEYSIHGNGFGPVLRQEQSIWRMPRLAERHRAAYFLVQTARAPTRSTCRRYSLARLSTVSWAGRRLVATVFSQPVHGTVSTDLPRT
jgi:hypothetical protein